MRIKFKDFTGLIESFFRNDVTVPRVYQFPDKNITVAGVDDVAVAQAAADAAQADADAANAALPNKADLVGGTVPANQLPSFVDDVLEFANLAAFPVTGETSKIYIALDTNLTYRWTGSVYGVLDPSLALGETSSTAYRGDRGKTAFDHSQDVTTNPHSVTAAQVGAAAALGNYSANAVAYANGDTLQVFANKTKTQVENTVDISTAPIAGDVTGTLGASVVAKIQGRAMAATLPTTGQAIVWNGTTWLPASVAGTLVDWSASANPQGTVSTSILNVRYVDDGVKITLYWYITGVTTTGVTTFTFTLPVAPNALYPSNGVFEPCHTISNVTASLGMIGLTGGSTTASLFTSVAAAAWSGTAGHAKSSRGTVTYFK